MNTDLTLRQKQILQYIEESLEGSGFPPTNLEIRQRFGFGSPNAVATHLKALEGKGYIRRHPRKARGLELVHRGNGNGSAVGDAPQPPAQSDLREKTLQEILEKSQANRGKKASKGCYEVGIEVFFNARHWVSTNGGESETHPHSWRLQTVVQMSANGHNGYVLGFAELRGLVQGAVEDFNNTVLNKLPPFAETQPTTENVTLVLYGRIKAALSKYSVKLKSVTLWESPTVYVSYSENEDYDAG